jgi:hypothetical protein
MHFPPFWAYPGSPRFTAAHDGYPDGYWTQKFIVDYLLGFQLLTSFYRSLLNAVFFLPVYRFTVPTAQQPLAGARNLRSLMALLFSGLEQISPALAGGSSGGTTAGIGVSCFSAGAHAASAAFATGQQRQDIEIIRSVLFLDGAPSSGQQVVSSLLGTPQTHGWLDLPAPAGSIRHASLFQQSNNRAGDLVQPVSDAIRSRGGRIQRGTTAFLAGRTLPDFGELAFHWPDSAGMASATHLSPPTGSDTYEFWHGRIARLFVDPGLSFARRSLPH